MKASTRKQDICKAFLTLYHEKDIPQLSIREVCAAIPIARTSFYHYFDNLYDVLEFILEETLKELETRNTHFYCTDLMDRKSMEPCCDTLYYIQAHTYTFQALFRHQGTNGFVHRWKKIIIRDFQKKYLFLNRSTPNLPVILQLTASGIVGLYEYWVFHPDLLSIEEITEGILFQLCHTLV